MTNRTLIFFGTEKEWLNANLLIVTYHSNHNRRAIHRIIMREGVDCRGCWKSE